MLTLRPANILDLPPLYALACDTKHTFLDDYHDFDLEYAHGLCGSQSALIIDFYGYPAGAIWFTDQVDDLHCQIHVLVNPKYWRQVLKQKLLIIGVDWAFENLKVKKVLAEVLSTQRTAIKLLRQHKFYEHPPWLKHTKQNGVVVDVIRFEARKKYWRRIYGIGQ